MPPGSEVPPIERQIVWLVAMVQLVNILDFMMVMPLGPDFAVALGFAESDTGLVAGAYTFAAAISGLVCAQFLDKFDRKTALTFAMAGLAVGTAVGGLAFDLNSLIGARVVAGVFGGPATALSLAIIADIVPAERRGRAMAIVMTGFSVASVLGIPAGLTLARVGSWRTPFFGIAILALVVTAIAVINLPSLRGHIAKVPTARVRVTALLSRPELLLALAASSLTMLSIFALVPNMSAFIQHNLGYPRDRLELLYLAGGAASFIVLMIAGRSVDRIGAVPVSVVGASCMIVASVFGFIVTPSLLPVVVVFILFMCSGSLRSVSMSTLVSRLPNPNERAQYMSLQSAVQHISGAVAAVLSAQILSTAPNKFLVGFDDLALGSIVLAAMVPVMLVFIQRAVHRTPEMPILPLVIASDVL